ncbi:hypothetical protein FA15DRAFT_661478 [Coprinopsis marcescibilis]|uniref:Uncharacterized protein n=1 Tax=Coprinopsis marcescibilis TaxID=230819 RepID=A0A5C3KCA6_COPMA|nr:hypothetical protein FA15DRAFT_661478 [Coprinopsis marcescibilis]
MPPRKLKKTHKISYAERVLSALNSAHKNKRKHSIHMTSLRSQIKKTAESKDDSLGPQWSHWVTKAIHKLKEDGIVDTSDHNVFLTPLGRDSISAAKRSVRYVTDPEERVFKHVASALSKGHKRPLPLSSGDPISGLPRSRPHNPEHESISAAPASKRPRRGNNTTKSSTVATSLSTTATVPTPPKRRGRPPKRTIPPTSPADRDISPLTDVSELDAEEHARLRATISAQDNEISGLRRLVQELTSSRHAVSENATEAGVAAHHGDDDDDSLDRNENGTGDSNDDRDAIASNAPAQALGSHSASNRWASLPFNGTSQPIPNLPSVLSNFPLKKYNTLTNPHPGLFVKIRNATAASYPSNTGLARPRGIYRNNLVARTESGTIIPHLSKQPTPAPSEGGSGEPHTEAAEFDYAFVPDQEASVRLPEISPGARSGPQAHSDAQVQAGTAHAGAPNNPARQKDQEQAAEIAQLNAALSSEHDQLLAAKSEIARLTARANVASAQSLTAQAHSQRLEAENATLLQELQQLLQMHKELAAELRQSEGETETVAHETRHDLAHPQTQTQTRVSELEGGTSQSSTDAAIAISELRQSVQDARGRLRAVQGRCTSLEIRLRESGARLMGLEGELESVRMEKQGLDGIVGRATADLGQERERRSALEEELRAKEDERNLLWNKVTTCSSEVARMQDALVKAEDDRKFLVGELTGAREKIANMEHSLVVETTRLQTEQQQLKENVTELEGIVRDRSAELEGVKRILTEVEFEREQLRAQMVGVGTELLAARMDLEAEKRRAKNMEFDLANEVGMRHQVEQELDLVKAAKQSDEKTICGLKDSIDGTRRRLLEEFDQLSNQCVAAKSTPEGATIDLVSLA